MGNLRGLCGSRSPSHGFTLLETAIVLLIAAIILVAVWRSEALIDQARVSDLEQITRDLSHAAREFKNRYHYLPGDLLNANTDLSFTPPWAPSPGPCDIPPAATSGDGLINTAAEISCVLPHLGVAGYPPTPTIQHIVEFSNVPLEMAQDLDRKLDDGNLNTGTVQSNVAPPVDPVAFLAVPL